MKNIRKYGMILVTGLVVAVLFYPFLHEIGHALVAVIVGTDIVEVSFLPIPSILCNLKEVESYQVAIIGLGGSIVPFFLTICLKPNRFIIWYMCFTVRWISLLSFIISLVAVFLFEDGNPILNEDVTQVLRFTPHMAPLYRILFTILAIFDVILIIKSKPLKRCENFIK